jgi:hypothetical protein
MDFGGETTAAELEVIVVMRLWVDKKTLSVTSRFEPLHLPLSPSRRLMRHLATVVKIATLHGARLRGGSVVLWPRNSSACR